MVIKIARKRTRTRKKTYKQTGTRKSIKADRQRKAKLPGWRISKSGRRYFENRKNRSDKKGKRI